MIKPGIRDLAWMVAGAAGLLVVMLLVLLGREEGPAEQLVLRARQVVLADRMFLGLASASEAEKSAVMATTDEDSRKFAEEARAATGTVVQASKELGELLTTGGKRSELQLLREFSKSFAELQRIHDDLLDLVVRNTNLEASRLAFGSSAASLEEMDAALVRVMSAGAAGDPKVLRIADEARIAALRIQALLPPHIAEESDRAMDEMERAMAGHDRTVHDSLAALAAMPALRGSPDLEAARSGYARLSETRARILELSRENTHARSVALSLRERRKATLACREALTVLRDAIAQEPGGFVPVNPR